MGVISATVIADSVCVTRITTFVIEFPRFILPEVLTHRMLSRNTSSSRAVPTWKLLKQVWENPATPVRFGVKNKGMQDGGNAPPSKCKLARLVWMTARYPAILSSFLLSKIGIHKQIANRLIEPWMTTKMLVTATEWENFYRLRYHPDAQPEFQELARLMLVAHSKSEPQILQPNEWHIPFKGDVNLTQSETLKVCTARCARVSYLNFLGKDSRIDDFRLHDELYQSKHFSPFEHCAQAMNNNNCYANYRGFQQYRALIPGESGVSNSFAPKQLLEKS